VENLPCRAVKKTPPPCEIVEGQCAGPAVCPLTRVAAGTVVCVKQLAHAPDVRDRLRELGLGEEQRVKLVSRQSSVICQVCNARVALSEELAKAIFVEPVPPSPKR
jgi:Fe2+ transport system protein FeoA